MSITDLAPGVMTEDEFFLWLSHLSQAELRLATAGLSAEQRAVLARWLAARAWRSTPATMAAHLTNGRVQLYRHFALLGQKFADAVELRSPRQIWNLPARVGKSEMATGWGPAWALDRYPWMKIMVTSYGDELAHDRGAAIRSILNEHKDELRVSLAGTQRASEFATSDGGGMRFTGIMSSATGFGANGLVIDDPYKNWQDAHSPTIRLRVMRQYRSVFRFRFDAGRPPWTIICHTRWHEDDMTAELMQESANGIGENFELVRLPMIAERYDPTSLDPYLHMRDPLGREAGDLLVPEMFDAEAVHARATVGSYLTSSMEQQRPAPEEGGIVKRAWWKLEPSHPVKADEWITSWDFKGKDSTEGDYVCGGVWLRTGKDCWLVDIFRGVWDMPTATNAVALAAIRWPDARRHWFENAALAPEVRKALISPEPGYTVSDDVAGDLGMTVAERVLVQDVRRRGLGGILRNTVKEDKPTRMRAVSGYIEAGDVHIFEREPWLGAYLEEMSAFPNGANDDQVDMTSQALSKLHRIGSQAPIQTPEGRVPETRPSRRTPGVQIPAHLRAAVEQQLSHGDR